MEAALLEMIKSAPTAAAIIVVVVLFLKHLATRDQEFIKHLQSAQAVLSSIEQRNEETHKQCSQVIRENTLMLGKVSEALHSLGEGEGYTNGQID